MALHKITYSGTFIHCSQPDSLEILTHTTVGVDEHGKIAFIVPSTAELPVRADENWEKGPSTRDNEFFFPGLIGKVHQRSVRVDSDMDKSR